MSRGCDQHRTTNAVAVKAIESARLRCGCDVSSAADGFH